MERNDVEYGKFKVSIIEMDDRAAPLKPKTGLSGPPYWATLDGPPRQQRSVGRIFSRSVVEGHGLSTSTIRKGPVQERKPTELRERSLEGFPDYKCNRVLEWQRRCESSEKSNVWCLAS
jgi:hypothetical protein